MFSVDTLIRSPIVQVNFAGFRSTTAELQRNGWALSAYQDFDCRMAARTVRLMMHHESGGLTMVSKLWLSDMGDIQRVMQNQALPPFDVIGVSLDGRSTFVSIPKPLEIDFQPGMFKPIDAMPSVDRIDLSAFDFTKFGVFKPLNESTNIYVEEKSVPELLKLIEEKQAPKQAEIRKKNRTKEFMEQAFKESPNQHIKAQLIAI